MEWQSPEALHEPELHERGVVWIALDNGDVLLADASAWQETASEYHSSTGVYLGQSLQDGWSGYCGWDGDVFERDEAGWHCYRYPKGDGEKVRVSVTGWMPAIIPKPAAFAA